MPDKVDEQGKHLRLPRQRFTVATRCLGIHRKAVELAEANGWFLARQFETDANARIHEHTTAREVLADQNVAMQKKDSSDHARVSESLHRIKDLGYRILEAVESNNFDTWGQLLDEHWQNKKKMSKKISLSRVDEIYDTVRQRFGVLGGKIIGAGGGGFLMLYTPSKPKTLERFMLEHGMPRMHYTVEPGTLPGYYGLIEGSWRHWARVWDVPYDYLLGRFKDKKLMEEAGIPLSRWVDGVLEAKENVQQPDTLKAVFFWGHAPNSQTRGPDMKKAFEKLDLLVIVDPYPTASAVMHDRTDNVYLLPAATQFETSGSVTASNRSVQWREKVFGPFFETKTDHEIMYLFAKKLGFDKEMFKQIKVEGNEPVVEDITREFNKGMWTIGYTGHSPERMKAHMANQATFDKVTLKANGGPCDGDYYGLPWPCWGTADMELPSGKKGHPGSPNLYDPSKPVAEGGLPFRANFGLVAPEKWAKKDAAADNLLATDSYPVGSEIKDGHPEVTMAMVLKLGWDADFKPNEKAFVEKLLGVSLETAKKVISAPGTLTGDGQAAGKKKIGFARDITPETFAEVQAGFNSKALAAVNWKNDMTGGIQRVSIKHGVAPFGNAKARCVVWNFPDAVPLHREPLYTPRRDLVAKYPTHEDRKLNRLPTLFKSIQDKDVSKEYPIILTSGRLVEYEGGGEETRSNPWLAELQQDMFVEINTTDANNLGIRNGEQVWVEGAEKGKVKVMAMVTERVGKGVAFMPFHFAGHFQGKDLRSKYPEGADPFVLGEAANTATTYGYDVVTQMQETKTTLCKIWRA